MDNVGSVIGLEQLGITRIAASAINVGSGMVKTSHGILPIPAPATAELLTNIPCYQSSVPFELTTPTGAVIISTLGSSFGPLPPMKVERIAYGAGDKEFPGHAECPQAHDRTNPLQAMKKTPPSSSRRTSTT